MYNFIRYSVGTPKLWNFASKVSAEVGLSRCVFLRRHRRNNDWLRNPHPGNGRRKAVLPRVRKTPQSFSLQPFIFEPWFCIVFMAVGIPYFAFMTTILSMHIQSGLRKLQEQLKCTERAIELGYIMCGALMFIGFPCRTGIGTGITFEHIRLRVFPEPHEASSWW